MLELISVVASLLRIFGNWVELRENGISEAAIVVLLDIDHRVLVEN